MERWAGKVAVVTGASAGIGLAICKDLVEQGMVVIGLARREDRLKELKEQLKGKSGTLHFVKTDISKEDEIKSAFKWIKEKLGGVDVMINNAGNNVVGAVNELQLDDWQRVYGVNVFAVAMCSREAVNSMKERNFDGHVIIVNSVAAFNKPHPNGSVYASSKHASKQIAEGLRRDVIAQKLKIKVSSLSPGLVASEFFEANDIKVDFSMMAHLQPEDIAAAVRYVISTPPNVLINEITIRSVSDDI